MTDLTAGTVAIKTLLLVDLVDSTRMVETLGDARAAELWHRHDSVARKILVEYGGREIDKTDGFLFLFDRPIDAVRYAIAYHGALQELGDECGYPLSARAGIHLGEVVLRENRPDEVARGAKPLEVDGLAKPMAARVMSLAEGRQTLLTKAAFDMARRAVVGTEVDKHNVRWMAHGPYRVKGVEEPVEVGEVGIEGVNPLRPPKNSEKAMRDLASGAEEMLGWRPAKDVEIPNRPGWILQEKLGEGAHGEVWVGKQEETDKRRIFKFCFNSDGLRILRHEVTLLQLMRDCLGVREDIGVVRDWSLEEPPYFIESRYASGVTLREWGEEHGGLGKVPLDTRLEIVAQAADALGAAHSVGVLHKDVKPTNILIKDSDEGSVLAKLIDFGIGVLVDHRVFEDTDLGIDVTESLVLDKEHVKRTLQGDGMEKPSKPPVPTGSSASQLYMAPELLVGGRPSIQSDLDRKSVV